MHFTIKDEIIDYAAIAKSIGVEAANENVATHIATITIKNKVPATLVNMIRYILMCVYPTRRLRAEIMPVTFPDEKMIEEPILTQIQDIKLTHDCPLQTFTHTIIHNRGFDEPLIITFDDSPIEKFTNHHKIDVLGKGRAFSVKCEVVEANGIDSGLTSFYFAPSFDRTNTVEVLEKLKSGTEVRYNQGSFSFAYTDNIGADKVFSKALEIGRNIISTIIDNFAEHYLLDINRPYLHIPHDRSAIIATTIASYVFEINQTAFVASPEMRNYSRLTYPRQTADSIEGDIKKGLANLLKDLS